MSFGQKLWSKEEAEEKGPSLVYRFQQSMESRLRRGGIPKSNNQMQKERSKAISMLVDMETEDGLKRCAVMVVAKKLAWHMQTYSTIRLKNSLSVMYFYGFNIQ